MAEGIFSDTVCPIVISLVFDRTSVGYEKGCLRSKRKGISLLAGEEDQSIVGGLTRRPIRIKMPPHEPAEAPIGAQ